MKSILASRTFWLNLLGLIGTVAEVLPARYSLPVLAIANIALRFVTNKGVYVLPPQQ